MSKNLYPAFGHPEGIGAQPWFTIRGDQLYPAFGHPKGITSAQPWYSTPSPIFIAAANILLVRRIRDTRSRRRGCFFACTAPAASAEILDLNKVKCKKWLDSPHARTVNSFVRNFGLLPRIMPTGKHAVDNRDMRASKREKREQ